jgi:hypothetical protein
VEAVRPPASPTQAQPGISAEEIAAVIARVSDGSTVTPEDVQSAIRAVREGDDT